VTIVRRIGAYAGLWLLVAGLGLAMVFVAAATPRTVNEIQDTALRRMIAEAPYSTRDITYVSDVVTFPGGAPWPSAITMRRDLRNNLPGAIDDVLGRGWSGVRSRYSILTGTGVSRAPDGLTPLVRVFQQTDMDTAVRMVKGRFPASPRGARGVEPTGDEVVEIMATQQIAEALGLTLDQDYRIASEQGGQVTARTVGIFTPADPADPTWEPDPELRTNGLQPVPGVPGDRLSRRSATVVTDELGIEMLKLAPSRWGLQNVTRFRLDENRLDADQMPALRNQVARLDSVDQLYNARVQTRLDQLSDEFGRQAAAVRALVAVIAAGILGAALGLLALAARLAADRRATELRLLRARGAAVHRVAARLAAESVAVVVPAAAAGWALHLLLPGRPPVAAFGTGWGPVFAGLAAVVAVPVVVALAHRRVGTAPPRRDLIRLRPGVQRLTFEATVLLLAVVGVYLLHRRGLSLAGIDPYLSAVPVLAGAAVGLVALRVYPWPVRGLDRVARRLRGGVAFLGLARAGRAPAGAALPLVVLVLAVGVGGFAATVRGGIAQARDTAAAREVGADVRLTADAFLPGAVGAVAAVPGVTTVAIVNEIPAGALRSRDSAVDSLVKLFIVDVPAYRRILDGIGLSGVTLPPELLDPQPDGNGRLPVLASTVASRVSGLSVRLGPTFYDLRVVGVADRPLPGLLPEQFVIVPRAAVSTVDYPVTELLVGGTRADPTAVHQAALAGRPAETQPPITAVDRVARRQDLERSAFNDGISLAFTTGTAAALVAGLLAIGLTLMVDAAARGRALSLLRTMGLAPRQARRLLLVELLPLMATALLAGAALGIALPRLLAPALGLSAFTSGTPVPTTVDVAAAGLLAAFFAVLMVAGIVTEAAANRRLGLGQVLRV